MALSIGFVLNNRYRIVSLLGQGGMGAVYRTWDMNLNIPVAIKDNQDTTAEAQRQFTYEAQILAHLSHPNLVRVTDFFSIASKGQYLVMDFVEGEDLQSLVERQGTLAESQALTWVLQICSALEYLHTQNPPVIHRDIKPANIKIRTDGRAMLVDFGISKVYNAYMATTMGAKAVTPGFSPPEQYGTGRTDARSDIYSLGATLYFLLTGKVLPESVQRATENKPIQSPRMLNPRISPVVEQAVIRATDVSTSRRFQSVSQMRLALVQQSAGMVAPAPAVSSYPAVEETMVVPQSPVRRKPPVRKKKAGVQLPSWLLFAVAAVVIGVPLVFGGVYALFGVGMSATVTPTAEVSTPIPTMRSIAVIPATSTKPANTALPPPSPTRPPTQVPPTHIPPTLAPPTAVPPTEPLPAGKTTLVLEKNYNCRGSPTGNGELIWTFPIGSVLEIIGKSDTGWWLVRINDPRTRRQQCWISGGQPSGDVSGVPISNWTGTVDTAKTPWP